MQPFADSLMASIGFAPGESPRLYIIRDNYPEAYTALTDSTDFAVCLTTGLIGKTGCTYDMLRAIAARQAAHGVLKHQLRFFYDNAKRKRRDRLTSGIVFGAALTAYAALTYFEPDTDTGDEYYYFDNRTLNVNVDAGAQQRLPASIFSDEQQYEADLVGLRFMQREGKGDVFLEALKMVAPAMQAPDVPEPAGPVMNNRIEFLRYVINNPDIENKKARKIRRKALKANSKK